MIDDQAAKELGAIMASMESLDRFHRHCVEAKSFTGQLALESEKVLGHARLSNMLGMPRDQVRRVAMESIWDETKNLAQRAYEKMLELVRQFIDWIRRRIDGQGFRSTSEQVKAVQNVLGDRQLAQELNQILTDTSFTQALQGSAPAMESNSNERLRTIFQQYKESLSEYESDFVTSGKGFQLLLTVVNEYNRNKYPQLLKTAESDVAAWMDDGFRKAPFTGNDDDVVERWLKEHREALKAKRAAYEKRLDEMAALGSKVSDRVVAPNGSKLLGYYSHPSTLFPELERQWRVSGLENVSREDRELLRTLQEIAERYSKAIKSPATSKTWPALDEVIRSAIAMQSDVVDDIQQLMFIWRYIQRSGETAYTATQKSFRYIAGVLVCAAEQPGANAQAIKRTIDLLRERQNTLNDVIKLN